MTSVGGPGLFQGAGVAGAGGHVRMGAGRVRFGQRVTYTAGHRLADALKAALLHTPAQVRDRGLAGVEGDVGGLRDRVGLYQRDPRPPA
jgi:hypothetical protein